MPYQPWIADQLRDYGLNVIEEPGWTVRGSTTFTPKALVVHHTASRRGSDVPSLPIVLNGRSDLPGPLCHVLIGRSGICHVIAAGRANHAGSGSWQGVSGNANVLGIEAENDGIGEPWPDHQMHVFVRASAALLEGIGRGALSCCAHREWTPRKIDPAGIDMFSFRNSVSLLLKETPNMATITLPANRDATIKRIQKALKVAQDGDPYTTTALAAEAAAWAEGELRREVDELKTEKAQLLAKVGVLEGLLDDVDGQAPDIPPDLLVDAELGRLGRQFITKALTDG